MADRVPRQRQSEVNAADAAQVAQADSGSAGAGTPAVGGPEKDPADWVTGGEPPTGPQLSYLSTLAQQAGEPVPDDLTKADASRMIDELKAETGRGQT